MAGNNSDYSKPRTNLNDRLPVVIKSKIATTLNENLYNRYLSKAEYSHVDGIIGAIDPATSVAQISEPTVFDQTYQLQPIAYNKIGTVDWFLSFEDLLSRLENLGVDTTKYNEWGATMQFNWVPPIDMDKLINYQNYYWNSSEFDDNPQYITIKNQCNWTVSRLKQMQRGIVSVAPTFTIANINISSNIISVPGNESTTFLVNEVLISYDSNGNYGLFLINSVTFNNSSLNTDIVVSAISTSYTINSAIISVTKTAIPIERVDTVNNQIILNGDLHLLFTNNYIFSTIGSSTNPTTYWNAESSSYNNTTEQTTITVSNMVTTAFNWGFISILPFLSLASAENVAVCSGDANSIITTWMDYLVGNLIWTKDYTIVGNQNTGSTTLASNVLLDNNINFIESGVMQNDLLIIYYSNGVTKEYTINYVEVHTLTVNIPSFFTLSDINYTIVRKIPFNTLISTTAPVSPSEYQFWVNSSIDTLNQWNGSEWITLQTNISLLYNTLNNRYTIDLIQTDDWSTQNKWINRNDITNFSGLTNAQMPIIEYNPYLELSNTSYSTKSWLYRPTATSNYIQSTLSPSLFEIANIILTSVLSPDFYFPTANTIILNQKYGNLTASLTAGTKIMLSGFNSNNGTYTVSSSEFIQLTSIARYVTQITLTTNLPNIADYPENASIYPVTTAYGDSYLGPSAGQWLLDGISSVTGSSIVPTVNPMLNILANSYSSSQAQLDSLIGLVWQEFKLNTNISISGIQLSLDASLHDLALYNNQQDGDVRVYLDGVRQYGNYTLIQSTLNPGFVGGFTFNDTVTITDKDIIRIELGEYALEDIGKRSLSVLTAAGIEQMNLVDTKLVQQEKTDTNQYPEFCIYDINENPQTTTSPIFTFQEDPSNSVNGNLLMRVAYDSTTNNYTFMQGLLGNNNTLYLYKDFIQIDNEFQSIWKKGTNNEQYVPQQLSSGQWAIPNPWYYNIEHANNGQVNLSDLYTHFSSIIDAQQTPGVFSPVGTSLFYLDDNINYGLGGTIKEHNNGLDLLVSSLFVNNVNSLLLIQFAHDQYLNNLNMIQNQFQINAGTWLSYNTNINSLADLITYVYENIKEWFEANSKYDQWFGDSTTYNQTTETGIKNWIATIPYVMLGPKYSPYIVYDPTLNITSVLCHDGHRQNIEFSLGVISQIFSQLQNNTTVGVQSITSNSTSFPTTINGNGVVNGSYLIRTNTVTSTTSLYRYNSNGVWEFFDLNQFVASIILNFEESLYNNLPLSSETGNFTPVYNVSNNKSNNAYQSLAQEQFASYANTNNIITPYSSANIFTVNNAFTWNYAYTPIPIHPVTGEESTNVEASWQALYTIVYGTPYPHREPWILQGYIEQPSWWNTTYLDTSGTRYWSSIMWQNIFAGIIPSGNLTPSGTTGTGQAGQITTLYKFVSVNVDINSTEDGILPDGLLPPFWDSNNTTNGYVRSLYDPSQNQFITTPQSNYVFGQNGPYEWQWNASMQRAYDDLIISFKLDPIQFTYLTFGIDLIGINCLQVDQNTQQVFSHANTIFHGDFIPGTDEVFISNGLNQWYVNFNRYNGYDDITSGFKPLWIDWGIQLSYLFNSFIDTSTFNIASNIFDITDKDYSVLIKETQNISNLWLDSIVATILNIPSIYIANRNTDSGWTVQFNSTSPIARNLEFYGPENYPYRAIPLATNNFSANTFRIYSYNIANIGLENIYAYLTINYNQALTSLTSTNLSNTTFNYWFAISINGGELISYSIAGNTAQTFGALIDQINAVLGDNASASIINGNIVIQSNLLGSSSSINVADNGLFVSALPSSFNGVGSQVLSQIQFLKYFIIYGNQTAVFTPGSNIVISESTNFNGTYTISNVTYNISTKQTTITVNESVSVSNMTVDGVLEPVDSITLPLTWSTGTQIYLSTDGVLSSGLNINMPYYVIVLNDREFQLSASLASITSNYPITVSSAGSGDQFVGRVQSTFSISAQNVPSISWFRHYSDTRIVNSIPQPLIISGIQAMVDFLKGYEDYLTDQGFVMKTNEGVNVDPTTGRIETWELETEKFITQLYNTSAVSTAQNQIYQITPVNGGNYFILNNNITVNWQLGTQVILSAGVDSQLPATFNNPLFSYIPYYIIPTLNKNTFQLALSLSAATAGNAIAFTDNGFGDIYASIYVASGNYPTITINPFKNYLWIETPQGILADVFAGNAVDSITTQYVYDNNGVKMTPKHLLVLREDKECRMSLTLKQQEFNNTNQLNQTYMQGMHLFLNGYEHVILFNNYSTDDYLIYDPFLGLVTPRFYLDFNKQPVETLRPNMGGFVLQDNELVPNFEASVDNLRYAYSPYRYNNQQPSITEAVYNSLGYSGTTEYMDSLNVNTKSQFIFWRGMIHAKGTQTALDAFLKHSAFGNLTVDQFWAYKYAIFGNLAPRNYIDMKVEMEDVSNTELRLEFVLPDSTALDDTFTSIRLTDMSRWWNQPDQLSALSPTQTFYFSTIIEATITNAQTKTININGQNILILPQPANGIIATYYDSTTSQNIPLEAYVDYTYLNSMALIFPDNILSLSNVTVYVVSYDYNSQNPARIVDKLSDTVVQNIPIWNPAFSQYYYVPMGIVTFKTASDPAKYTYSADNNTSNDFWSSQKVGQVWLDDSIEGYYPYYDQQVYPNVNDQLANWGKLADWASLTMYQWTESTVPPSQYDALVIQQANDATIAQQDKITGQVYNLLYQNTGTSTDPVWVHIQDQHFETVAGLISQTPITLNFNSSSDNTVNVYINGIFEESLNLGLGSDGQSNDAENNLLNYILNQPPECYIHIVLPAYIPTQADITNLLYKYDTPYTVVTSIDPNSAQPIYTYYFWVNNAINQPLYSNTISIYEAQNMLNNMNAPYMIITGFRGIEFGYGLVYGDVFDENSWTVPYRFAQCIVRGLANIVTADDRYALEFTRDFTLRDQLPTNTMLNDIHVEWVLFRQNQLELIDSYLWDKLIEALTGYAVANGALTTTVLPDPNRVLYDSLYGGQTRFGLGSGQIFTDPTISLNTIQAVLQDPTIDFGNIDISTFLQQYSFNTPNNILIAMTYIYNNFPVSAVNYIYFQTLYDAISLKEQYAEFMKTSWLAIEIEQNITQTSTNTTVTYPLSQDGSCYN